MSNFSALERCKMFKFFMRKMFDFAWKNFLYADYNSISERVWNKICAWFQERGYDD